MVSYLILGERSNIFAPLKGETFILRGSQFSVPIPPLIRGELAPSPLQGEGWGGVMLHPSHVSIIILLPRPRQSEKSGVRSRKSRLVATECKIPDFLEKSGI